MATDKPIDAGAPEIEVTPEMIEAGKNAVMSLWSDLASAPTTELYEEAAISIYWAMLRSRVRSPFSWYRT
jgi:hypothetical protein